MKRKTNRRNSEKLHFLVIQDADGRVVEVLNSYHYDSLVIEGMEKSKEVKGFYTILDTFGKTIDGNFNAGLLKKENADAIRTDGR